MEATTIEAGATGSVDLLIFEVDNRTFGINVAKVQEIVEYQEVTPIPKSHYLIEGMFMSRDTMITVIDLRRVLHLNEAETTGDFILTNFNALNMAFHVDTIKGIYRVTWGDIMKPGPTVDENEGSLTTGVVKYNGQLIIILDVERIVADINPDTGLKVGEIDKLEDRSRIDIPILVSEDSLLLNRLIVESLERAGYTSLTHTANGKEAWDLIEKWRDEGSLNEHVQCVITDIEMPQMDGHMLTKLIKEDPQTQNLKVIIFSSMINESTRRKGELLGADGQITKPEIGLLVGLMDSLLGIQGEDPEE